MYLRPIRMALVLDNKLFRGETQVHFALQAECRQSWRPWRQFSFGMTIGQTLPDLPAILLI